MQSWEGREGERGELGGWTVSRASCTACFYALVLLSLIVNAVVTGEKVVVHIWESPHAPPLARVLDLVGEAGAQP